MVFVKLGASLQGTPHPAVGSERPAWPSQRAKVVFTSSSPVEMVCGEQSTNGTRAHLLRFSRACFQSEPPGRHKLSGGKSAEGAALADGGHRKYLGASPDCRVLPGGLTLTCNVQILATSLKPIACLNVAVQGCARAREE